MYHQKTSPQYRLAPVQGSSTKLKSTPSSPHIHLSFSSYRLGNKFNVTRKNLRRHFNRVYGQLQFVDISPPHTSTEDEIDPSSLSPTIPDSTTTATHTVLPDLWPSLAIKHPYSIALDDPHAPIPTKYTFQQLHNEISTFSSGLRAIGTQANDIVCLFSENSSRWLIADQAIQTVGAIDAVRGISSNPQELQYIMELTQCSGLVVQDFQTLKKVLPVSPPTIRWALVLWTEPATDQPSSYDLRNGGRIPVYSYLDVLELGRSDVSKDTRDTTMVDSPRASSAAILMFTSGTTSNPKAVQLSHSNILYQINEFPAFIDVEQGETSLSLLPPWHAYAYSTQLFVLSRGATLVYSNIKYFKEDLTQHPPDHFVCVPLVLETLRSRVLATLRKAPAVRRFIATTLLSAATTYVKARRVVSGVDIRYATNPKEAPRPLSALIASIITCIVLAPLYWVMKVLVGSKIRAALGIRKTVVSGGGSLAPHLDDFYEALELPILNGYGLTETSPVLTCRSAIATSKPLYANVRGSVGRAIPGTKIRIVDPDTYKDLPDGTQGLILAQGPGVSEKGYYNNPSATADAFQKFGDEQELHGGLWFNTGDLGWRAPEGSRMAGCLVLSGRAKDTIVLSSGENVEPQPIEDAITASPLIKFAILVGHGHRSLGALLVPDVEGLEAAGIDPSNARDVYNALRKEVANACQGRVRYEHVTSISILDKPFSFEDGTLTRTMKPRRAAIAEVYAPFVAELEAKLR